MNWILSKMQDSCSLLCVCAPDVRYLLDQTVANINGANRIPNTKQNTSPAVHLMYTLTGMSLAIWMTSFLKERFPLQSCATCLRKLQKL